MLVVLLAFLQYFASAPNGAADVGKTPIIRVRLVTAQNKPFEEVYQNQLD